MYGDDWRYAASRLNGTIVRLVSGEPIKVLDINDTDEVVVRVLGTRDNKVVKLNELDCSPVPLGFVNSPHGAQFVMRVPKRRDWRQGMRRENTKVVGPSGRYSELYLKRAILGVYPSFKYASSRKSKGKLTAWHRHWAIDSKGGLFYKAHGCVGSYIDGDFKLKVKWEYLREYLNGCISS